MKRVTLTTLFLALLAFMPLPGQAAALNPLLDGFAIHSLGSVEISGIGVNAVAVQPWNAKIVIGGEFTISRDDPPFTWTNLARINPDGTLDTSFKPPQLDGAVRALAIQPDQANPELGLIIAGGSFGHSGIETRNGLARFRSADGSLDDFAPATTPNPVQINAIALQGDGASIVVGGSFSEIATGVPSPNLARITVAAVDPGAASWNYTASLDGEVKAVLLRNGSILVGGSFQSPRALVAKLTANGSLDPLFQDGFITSSPGKTVAALAVQADGKVIVAGEFEGVWGGGARQTFLARLNRDGSHDSSFDPKPDRIVNALALQADGSIVAGGDFTNLDASLRSRLARIKVSGALDPDYAPEADAVVTSLALQPDGKLLAGGGFAHAGGEPRTRLARFYPYGALDDDIAGKAVFDDMVMAVSQQPTGFTNVGGLFWQVQGDDVMYLTRLTEEFKRDPAFTTALGLDGQVNAMLPLPRGEQMIGGWFWAPQPLVLRLDASGDPGGNAEITSYNGNLQSYLSSFNVLSLTPLARKTLLPNGTELADGMTYVTGDFPGDPEPYKYLFRVGEYGTRDESFLPDPVQWQPYSLVVQPDNKILVGGGSGGWPEPGKILRLKTDGGLDFDFTPVPLVGKVLALMADNDDGVIAGGEFKSTITRDGVT